MARRNWKRIQPRSLRHAMELCLDYARERENLSVDRVADLMGLPSKWALYKWMESGRLPAVLIRPFEAACGVDYVTRYLAHSAHLLTVAIPAGRRASGRDIHALQESFTAAVGLLLRFYEGNGEAEETIGALTTHMEELGWHRANVEKSTQPELDLFEEETA